MANFVCYLNLLLLAFALCALQGDATYNTYRHNKYVQVSFKQSEYTVRESDGRVAITIQAARRYFYDSFYVKIRASVNKDLKPYASSDDFEESIQTVKFWYRQSSATVYIKIKDDNRVESTEAFKLDILISRDLYSRGVKFGNPAKAKVFIKDDDKAIATKPPTMNSPRYGIRVSFSHAEYRVRESDGHVIIKAIVSGYRKFPIQLVARSFVPTKYKLPAANSKDFKVGEYKLYFPVSSDVATVKIPVYNDYIVEGTEAFAVNLYIPEYYRKRYVGYGDPFLTKVIIDDDDKHPVTKPPTPPPTAKPVKSIYVQFSQQSYVVDESVGYVVLKVTATGYRDIPISVNVETFVSSEFQPAAASKDDVRIGTTRLVFYPSDSFQTARVRIYDDKLVEGTEAFGVKLIVPDHHVANGVKLGNPSLTTVYIKDDDKPVTAPPTRPPTTKPPTTQPPTRPPVKKMGVRVRFQYGSYKIKESCTMLSVKLVVVGKVTKPFTIGVIPMSHHMPSAQAGKDFETGVQKVTFKPGQTYASVCIVVNDDDLREGTEKFRLVLSIPYSVQKLGVWAAYPYFADIVIIDDADDGMGLPVQPLPTDDQRATMCRCRPRPTPPTTTPTTPPTTTPTTPPTTLPPSTPPPPPQISVTFKAVSYSATESDGSITFTIQSSEAFSDEFSVEFCTQNSNPVSAEDGGVDYTELTQLVTFLPGETCVSVTVNITDDIIHEEDESFIGALKLTSSTPVHVSIGVSSTAVGIIINDDDLAVQFLNDTGSAAESDGSISFTVISLVPSEVLFTVQVCTRESDPRSAEADVDYISLVQNLTFNGGVNSRTFIVNIENDTIAENDETFEVILKPIPNSPFDVIIGEPSIATGIIFDDEIPTVQFLTDSSSAVESDGSISFTITSSVASDRPFTVQVCTREIVPLSAEANVDYVTVVQDITFNSGEISRIFTVDIINDTIAESEESFEVFLKLTSGSSGVIIGEPSVATGTIIDDEVLIVQFLQNASSAAESDGSISFTVISLVASDSPFTVQVCTRDTVPLSAEAGVDYDRLVLNITFDSGEVSSIFAVNIINDSIAESEESFEVFLKLIPGSSGVVIGEPSVATGTIFDDEIPTVRLLSNVSSARESDGFVQFTLVSSFPSDDPFTVQIFTMERNRTTATSGEDFEPVILNVTFEAGETLINVNVTIIPDNIVEDDERFYVQMIGFEDQPNTISEPDGAWVTIIDDDMTVRYEEIVVRGDESSGVLIFTLVTNEPAMETFTVQVCTRELNDTLGGGPASDGFATADVDYDSDVIDVIFNVGDSQATVAINITDDNIDEGNEAFGLELKRTDGTPDTVQITGLTIAFGIIDDNDEPGVRFQSSSSTAAEADGAIEFVVELTIPSDTVITVQVCTEETTPVSAQGGGVDFTDVIQNVTFEIGETVQTVSVPITRDSIIETAEEFNLTLKRVPGDNTNITILEPSVAVGIITDTTPGTVQFTQSVQSLSQTENVSPMRFELVLSRPVSRPFDVEVCTRSDSATGEGVDYITVSRNVTFFAGNTSQFFDVPLIDDSILEPTEQFTVVIKAIHLIGEQPIPPVVIGGITVATGTILDNDDFTVMFNDSTFSGAEADGVIAVTVVATGVSSVQYTATITPSELIPVSAREVFDYSNDTIVVTFNPGETEQTVLVVINPDCIREGSEFFNLTLSLDSTATNLGITLGDPSVATAEIEDTDIIYINFSQPMYSAEEADGMMIITVEADGFSIWPYSVEINPIELLPVGGPGNAEGNGTDFVSDTLIALFNPGDSQVNVSLPIIADQIFDPDERLRLTLTVPDEFSNLNGRLLIKPGSNDVAEGKIIESSVLVNFTAPSYRAGFNASVVIVRVTAFGSFDLAFLVEAVPDAVNIPEGDPFFNSDIRNVLFPESDVNTAIVPIQLFPEVILAQDMDLEFIVTLVVPDAARSQGVLLGEPNVATVTIPVTPP